MQIRNTVIIFIFLVSLLSCSQSDESVGTSPSIDPISEEELYFPPVNANTWETLSSDELSWNISAEQGLYDFLEDNNTNAFMVLKNGKIVIEWYFGDFTQNDYWYWASAGKTLTAFMVGIAQEEGFLNISDASSLYLGEGWSSLTTEQENAIKVFNHITMTTGLDYTESLSLFCTNPECLTYLNEPNTYWFYHNAPYTLTQSIISGAIDGNLMITLMKN